MEFVVLEYKLGIESYFSLKDIFFVKATTTTTTT